MLDEKLIKSWNINMRSNKLGDLSIPSWIIDEITSDDPSIFSLVEFSFCTNFDSFAKELDNRGFDYYPKSATENTDNQQNETIIAWKKDLFDIEEYHTYITSWTYNLPNFSYVVLRDKESDKRLAYAALRITMALTIPKSISEVQKKAEYVKQSKLRRKQMEKVINELDKLEVDSVCISGDFNCYRRGTNLKDWNINCLNAGNSNFISYTPDGQSIYEEKSMRGYAYEFAEDHFIVKNCIVNEYEYVRDFVSRDSAVYNNGKNYKNIAPGYPEHAILVGKISI